MARGSQAGRLKIGALASGNGSNLQAIIDACKRGDIDADIALVISNNPEARALQRATDEGIKAQCIDHRSYPDRETFDRAVIDRFQQAGVELVVLAGFMRRLSDLFIDTFAEKIMNIHPSLLPAFPGLGVQRQALEYGARFSGCTVHFVDKGLDTGPIILQAVVPIRLNDTEETLSARILRQEHRIYPAAVKLYAQGALKIEGRRVTIENNVQSPDAALINPTI